MQQFTNVVVQKIFENTPRDNTLYSFALRDYNKTYFNLGTTKPNFKEGQQISFEAEQVKDNAFKVDPKSVVVSGETQTSNYSAPFKQRTTGANRSAGVMTKDNYWENRELRDIETQKRIETQSCRNSAIAVAAVVFKVGSPAADVLSFVDTLTDKFKEQNNVTPEADSAAEAPAKAANDWS